MERVKAKSKKEVRTVKWARTETGGGLPPDDRLRGIALRILKILQKEFT